jgi:hypothetical protein
MVRPARMARTLISLPSLLQSFERSVLLGLGEVETRQDARLGTDGNFRMWCMGNGSRKAPVTGKPRHGK